MQLRPVHYLLDEATVEMLEAAAKYEKRFKIKFASLTYFSQALLNELHRSESDPIDVPGNVIIASLTDKTILLEMETLKGIANLPTLTTDQRSCYYSSLINIYHQLPSRPEKLAEDKEVLCVGPEREGRIVSEALGCNPDGHWLHPQAKRVFWEGGLIVGLGEFPSLAQYKHCLIIDSAIASGSTIIAIIEQLRAITSSFYIYSVHSSYEGLRAITRYGVAAGINITITVGHATLGMNDKFYATSSDGSQQLILGDVGDTISELVN